MKQHLIVIILCFLASLLSFSCFAEQLTLTTYYPAPYGVYKELTTTGNTYLATESGSVGIGTTEITNPGYNLEVFDDIVVTEPGGNMGVKIKAWADHGQISILDDVSTEAKIRLDGKGDSWFDSGNVGIGVTNPGAKLAVVPESGGRGLEILSPSAGNTHFPWTNNWNYISGNGVIFRNASHAEKMRIDLTAGKVGIGDPSPDSDLKLDVEGKVGATQYCDQDGNNCFVPGPPSCEVITAGDGTTYTRNHTGLVEITFNLSGHQAGYAYVGWKFYVNNIILNNVLKLVNYQVWPCPSYTYFLQASGNFTVKMDWRGLGTPVIRQIVIKKY